MTCEEQTAAFIAKYDWHRAEQHKNELTVCLCGGLLRSVKQDGRWTWQHQQTQEVG